MKIKCKVCDELICKYEADFKSSGAISLSVGKELKEVAICENCAKEIAKELIDKI